MLNTAQARDRALDFHWRIPENILSAAGIPDIPDRRQDVARRSVLAAACIAADMAPGEDRWVSYSRRKAFYAGQSRYMGLPYTYDRVLAAVAELVELGLIEEVRARPGDHLSTGMQSRLRATPDLVHAFRDAPFEYETRRCRLILKDEAGDVIGYDPTRQTRRLEAELDRINAYLGNVSVTMPTGDGWEHATRVVRARNDRKEKGTWASVVPTPSPEVYRVFGRGRWDRHGRLYGWWQNLPKGRRRELLINGEAAFEPDFATLHPRILYAARGHVLRHDPYVFWAMEPGTGVTTVSWDVTTTGSYINNVNAGGGAPTRCTYDYSNLGGPNCCVGNYTKTVGIERSSSPGTFDRTTTTESWGGNASKCLFGPGTKSQIANAAGFPKPDIFYVENVGLNKTYT
ncbi:MAG: hypothetical protein EOO66_03370, partial [Methylobacterium sp.]